MSQQSIHDRIMSRSQSNPATQAAPDRAVKPKGNWQTAVLALVGIAVVGTVAYAIGSGGLRNLISRPAIAETNEANKPVANTPFLQHAQQAGVQACSTIFPALGELLTAGSKYNVQSSWNDQTPDKHAIQAMVGMEYASANYSGPAAGIVFAAPTATACEGTMVRVAPFSKSCSDVTSLLPEGSKLANNLGQIAAYALPNNGGSALLLPSGNTCVVISVASAAMQQG